ncbi:MAG TPA: thioredoxin family protein [Lacibacter sp.]|nr:thioredoxin family protein [Lacibacter sp.]HMO90129.1 thioredoxin family protein [Lacibacter sp.]HMP85852.1 thioredoxin family protein [Lacibacter sp.]
MNFQEYRTLFEQIIEKEPAGNIPPYNNPDYLDYTRLNWSRMNRWMKTGKLSAALLDHLHTIDSPQQWIIITEPWCGDAAHNIPFLQMAGDANKLITVSYELRDAAPFRIDQYLTNGTKSIPKLIIRDAGGKDLGTWGPRPANCQVLYSRLKEEQAPFETVKVELQNWYNQNKGKDLQDELLQVLNAMAATA